MEIELKYTIGNRDKADRIWNDPYLKKLEEADSRHQGHFNGRYFDTEDLVLQKNDIAYRVRQEGTKVVASLKWNGETNGALHCREELNVNLGNDADTSPVPSVFSESEVGQKMLTLIGDKPLVCIMEVNVLRRHMRVDTGKSLVEISIDHGEIITRKGTEPICEVELELFGGEEKGLLELGDHLAQEYDLEMGTASKFARGLRLLHII